MITIFENGWLWCKWSQFINCLQIIGTFTVKRKKPTSARTWTVRSLLDSMHVIKEMVSLSHHQKYCVYDIASNAKSITTVTQTRLISPPYNILLKQHSDKQMSKSWPLCTGLSIYNCTVHTLHIFSFFSIRTAIMHFKCQLQEIIGIINENKFHPVVVLLGKTLY